MSPAWFGLSSLPTRRSVIRPVLMIFPLFLSCLLTFCHSGGVIWGRGPGRVKISVLFYSFLPLHLTDPLKSNSTMCCRGRERRGRGGPSSSSTSCSSSLSGCVGFGWLSDRRQRPRAPLVFLLPGLFFPPRCPTVGGETLEAGLCLRLRASQTCWGWIKQQQLCGFLWIYSFMTFSSKPSDTSPERLCF